MRKFYWHVPGFAIAAFLGTSAIATADPGDTPKAEAKVEVQADVNEATAPKADVKVKAKAPSAPDKVKVDAEAKPGAKAADARAEVKGAREEKRDTTRDAREATRDTREAVRDTRESTRDTIRETREDVRDTRRDTREAGSDADVAFRAADYRSADIGLWFNRSVDQGLVISDVDTTGAIAKLGFREGDRIISVNGQKVLSEQDFMRLLLAEDARASRIEVVVFRGGRQEIVYVEPAVFVEHLTYVDNDPLEQFGVILDDRYDDRIVVWRVVPRSPAYYAGIRPGDVLVTFQGRRVATRNDFVTFVRDLDPGVVAVEVNRGERMRKIEVDVPQYEARATRRTALRPDFDAATRREGRLERREERIEDRRDNIDSRTPRTLPAPAPGAATAPGAAPAPGTQPAPSVDPAPGARIEVKTEPKPAPRNRR